MTDPTQPPPYATDDDALARDTVEEFFRSSGPGGQHKNKRETGVRLHHLPSGVVVTATERRSQAMNRAVALERLRAQLDVLNAPPPPERRPTRPSRAQRERRLVAKAQNSQRKTARRYRPRAED